MIIKPIEYSKTFEVKDPFKGITYWEKMTIGGDISETDNVQECLQQLKDEVEMFHRKSTPKVTEVADNVPIPDVQVDKEPLTKLSKQDLQKKYLTDCKNEKELLTFSFLVKNNPHLQETFDSTLKKLTNGL